MSNYGNFWWWRRNYWHFHSRNRILVLDVSGLIEKCNKSIFAFNETFFCRICNYFWCFFLALSIYGKCCNLSPFYPQKKTFQIYKLHVVCVKMPPQQFPMDLRVDGHRNYFRSHLNWCLNLSRGAESDKPPKKTLMFLNYNLLAVSQSHFLLRFHAKPPLGAPESNYRNRLGNAFGEESYRVQ